jgi:hypothetical protein
LISDTAQFVGFLGHVVGSIPFQQVIHSDDMYDYVLDHLAISVDDLTPKKLKVKTTTRWDAERKNIEYFILFFILLNTSKSQSF